VTAPTRNQSVELLQVDEDALAKHLKPRLLLCAITGGLGWAVAYITCSGYAFPVGLWVRVTEIVPVLRALLGAVSAVLMALFSVGLEGGILVALFLFPMQ
jgi:predicted PurR-regulated permease PerM